MRSHKSFLELFVISLLALGLILTSCGRGHQSIEIEDTRTSLSKDGVSVQVFDENGLPISNPSASYRLAVNPTNNSRQIIVSLKDNTIIRNSYLEVSFDGTKEHPVDIQTGPALLEQKPIVYIGSSVSGSVICAQVTTGSQTHIANGELFILNLSPGKHLTRLVSDFNQDGVKDPIIADTTIDLTNKNKIYWTYKLRGDANVNREFDFADFGIVGTKYNQERKTNPNCEPADGSNNGTIDFADFKVIGDNYKRSIGLAVFRDDNPNPTTDLCLIDVSGKPSESITLKPANIETLASGFNRFSYTFSGKGRYLKFQLVDKNNYKFEGHQQIIDTEILTLAPPTDVTASKGEFNDKIEIKWTHAAGVQPDGYYLYRSSTSENEGFDNSISIGYVNSFIDTNIKPATTYWYKLISFKNKYYNSPESIIDKGYLKSEVIWSTKTGGIITPTGNSATFDPTGLPVGKYKITATLVGGNIKFVSQSKYAFLFGEDKTPVSLSLSEGGSTDTVDFWVFITDFSKVSKAPDWDQAHPSYNFGIGQTLQYYFDQHCAMTLNFWETWCGPCIFELPDLTAFAIENKDKRYMHIGCNSDTSLNDTNLWLVTKGNPFYGPNWTDNFNDNSITPDSLRKLFVAASGGVDTGQFVPVSYMITPDGYIVDVQIGALSGQIKLDWELKLLSMMPD